MVFGFITNLFKKGQVYNIRKRYDTIRENMNTKKKDGVILNLMKDMDEIEKQVIILEEMNIGPKEKRDMLLYIKTSLNAIESQLKTNK